MKRIALFLCAAALLMTACKEDSKPDPNDGNDYVPSYPSMAEVVYDAVTDIDGNVIKPATVRAVELYDLNGRRLVTAGKGVMIVRKYMSDGTIRVEKVVRK